MTTESEARAALIDYIANSRTWPRDEFIVDYRRWLALARR